MAEFPALPLWTDALVGDTYHLTPAEFGAYMRLLIAAWRTKECGLPNDDAFLGRIIGDPKNWHRIRQTVIPFFSMGSDGILRQKRLSDERAYVSNLQARSSAGGKAKALKRLHRGSAKSLPNECQTSAPTPTPTPIKKEEEPPTDKTTSAVKYAFDGAVIKLTAEGLRQWAEAFPHVDLVSELTTRDAWLSSESQSRQQRWFVTTSNHLRKLNKSVELNPKIYVDEWGQRAASQAGDW